MSGMLHRAWREGGAAFDGDETTPAHFGDEPAELRAALERCAVVDRSDLDRLVATGPDLLNLLHRLSTGDVKNLQPGEGRETVVTTAKGRIVERLFVHALGPRGVLLVAGPRSADRVIEHLRRYTFAERIELEDVTRELLQLTVIGPGAADALAAAGFPSVPACASASVDLGGVEVFVLGEDGLSTAGFSLAVPAASAASAWKALCDAAARCGGRPAGRRAAEAWRVLRGLPLGGRELTDERNPLEAGLRGAVSFTKGCYVGQEVVARLDTYDKVSRSLVGLVLPDGAELQADRAALYRGGEQIGSVTTVVRPAGRAAALALAFVKRKAAGPGDEVAVGAPGADLRARVVELPFESTA